MTTRRKVRVYVEGGSTGRAADTEFRRAWGVFLQELREEARRNNFHTLEVVRGKSRGNTFQLFVNHKNTFPEDLCVLLVDSECSVSNGQEVWSVVRDRTGDNWTKPAWATEDQLYLMVPFVEAWLLTDQDALQKFYKRDFKTSVLPTDNLENRSKPEIETALKKATKDTARGEYSHGLAHLIIESVRPEMVKTLYHGNRLFESMANLIRNNSV